MVASVFEVGDELWEVAEPLIPPVRTPARQGQRPVPDRVAFNAIVFVLVTGIAWRHVPRQIGCSGVTAWRRLRDWQAAGVWERLHRELWARGVKPVMARRATTHGSGLGRLRWVVERTFAWLHFFRRLRLRWERRPELHQAFMHLGCAVICQRYLRVL